MTDTIAALALKRNIRDLIAGMDPPIVPTTTLTVDAAAGDGAITVDPLLTAEGLPRFVSTGRVLFHDGKPEYNLPIAQGGVSEAGDIITLNVPGMLGNGLLSDHVAGTPVYTNLLAYGPRQLPQMLSRGDPVIYITCDHSRMRRHGMGYGFATYAVLITAVRPVDRLNLTLDPDVFAQQQEDAMLSDLERIGGMLLGNQELITEWAPAAALQFADIPPQTQNGDLIQTTWKWQQTSTGHLLIGQQLILAAVDEPHLSA